MAIFYGTVSSGFAVSSSFVLRASERSVAIGVGSAAQNLWFASFPAVQGGTFLRYIDAAATSGGFFSGTNGAWASSRFHRPTRCASRCCRR